MIPRSQSMAAGSSVQTRGKAARASGRKSGVEQSRLPHGGQEAGSTRPGYLYPSETCGMTSFLRPAPPPRGPFRMNSSRNRGIHELNRASEIPPTTTKPPGHDLGRGGHFIWKPQHVLPAVGL